MRGKGKQGLSARDRQIFLDGLKKFRERGVRILVDGKEVAEKNWDELQRIFQIRYGGPQRHEQFYMADLIFENIDVADLTGEWPEMVHEPGMAYGGTERKQGNCSEQEREKKPDRKGNCCRKLKEIRFDRVYHK
ncbi:MAG: hypothetical protein LUC99_05865 [Clostridiales bacterium]|nr:hypothetical protein [Clostridiales bacterium]